MIKQIFTKNAPEAIGCYSQAVQYDKLLFSSGQIPVNPENGEIVSGGIVPQAEQVMENIGAILKEAGTDLSFGFKNNMFLEDMNDFAAFNEVYAKYFTDKPARSCVAVKTLPKNVLCEVEVIAVVK